MSHTQCMRLDRGLIVEIVVMVKCGGQVLHNTPWKMTTRLVGKKSVVIGQEKSFYKRRLKEALHIRKFPNFNQNLDLDIILA